MHAIINVCVCYVPNRYSIYNRHQDKYFILNIRIHLSYQRYSSSIVYWSNCAREKVWWRPYLSMCFQFKIFSMSLNSHSIWAYSCHPFIHISLIINNNFRLPWQRYFIAEGKHWKSQKAIILLLGMDYLTLH